MPTMHSAIWTTQISTFDSTLKGALCPQFSRACERQIQGCFLTENKITVIVTQIVPNYKVVAVLASRSPARIVLDFAGEDRLWQGLAF